MSRHLAGLRLDLSCNCAGEHPWRTDLHGYGDEGGMALVRSRHLRHLDALTASDKNLSARCRIALERRYGEAYGKYV